MILKSISCSYVYIYCIKCRFPQQTPVYAADEGALSAEMWVNRIHLLAEDFTLNHGSLITWMSDKLLLRMYQILTLLMPIFQMVKQIASTNRIAFSVFNSGAE